MALQRLNNQHVMFGPQPSMIRRAWMPALLIVSLLLSVLWTGWSPGSAGASSSDLVPTTPTRLLDTRTGRPTIDGQFSAIGRRPAGSTLELQLTDRARIPADVATVALNVAAIDPADGGYLTVYPCGTPRPVASNVNYSRGTTRGNLVLARVDGQGRTCIYTSAPTHLTADVQAYSADGIENVGPARMLDTRPQRPTTDGQYAGLDRRPAGSTLKLQLTGRAGIPADAETVALNITVVDPDARGSIVVYPCDARRPNASNISYAAKSIHANLVLAPLDGQGRACIYTSSQTHLITDVQAFATDGMEHIGPARLLDSRRRGRTIDGQYTALGRRPAGSTVELQLTGRAGIPADAEIIAVNVTAVNPSQRGHITVYPCDMTRQDVADVSYSRRTSQANLVLAQVDDRGRTCIYTSARTTIIADAQAYTVSSSATPPPVTTLAPTTASTTTPPTIVTIPPTTTTVPVITLPPTTTTTVPVTLPTTTTTVPVPVTLPPSTTTAPPEPSGSGFVHPGVLVDRSQLDEIRAGVAAGRQPWASVVDRMYGFASSTATAARPTTYRFSSLSYKPAPVRVIKASSNGTQTYLDAHGLTEVGDVEHIDDARAAYTHALLWYATGNQAHADKAIEIMNAWSATLTEIKFDQPRRVDNGGIIWVDGKLHAGWGASLFARSGEIIRYSNAGWSNNDIARFETMLTDIYLPLTIDGWSNGANWLMTFSEANVSIGVFTNDRAAFNAGIDMWRNQAPTTIYHPSDGPRPLSPAPWMDTAKEIDNYWRNPDRYITGLQGETLRDLAHMTMGLGALANTAETAYIQGIDLYGEQADRIIAGFELNAGYVNDYLDETARLGRNPSSDWTPTNWPGPAGTFNVINTYHTAGWLVAHHHYTTRTNHRMPQTTRLVTRLAPKTAQPAHHLSWEALTHAP